MEYYDYYDPYSAYDQYAAWEYDPYSTASAASYDTGYETSQSPLAGLSPYDFAPGSGMYSIGDNVYGITATPSSYTSPGTQYSSLGGGGVYASGLQQLAQQYMPQQAYMPQQSYMPQQAPQAAPPAAPRPHQPPVVLGEPGGPVWKRLQDVMANPEKITGDPAYQFLYNQGLQALNRSLAAQRLTHSGKALTDTLNYGQGAAANYFNQLTNQLRGVAQDELSRWYLPAQLALKGYGLGQADVGLAQRASAMDYSRAQEASGAAAMQNLLGMLSSPSTAGIGYGPISSGYTPRLWQSFEPSLPASVGMSPVDSFYDPWTLAMLAEGGPEDQFIL